MMKRKRAIPFLRIALVAGLILLAPGGQAGDAAFLHGQAWFGFDSEGLQPVPGGEIQAHARASKLGSSHGGMIVRIEFERPGGAGFGFLVLDLPSDLDELPEGSVDPANMTLLYYEVGSNDPGLKTFLTDSWEGGIYWLRRKGFSGPILMLDLDLKLTDYGPDQQPASGDERIRRISEGEIRLFQTLSPVPLSPDRPLPETEVYAGGEIVYYDDGCASDPVVDDYDDYTEVDDGYYYEEDDTGCDGDTFDDDSEDAADDPAWGGWEGDDWEASPDRLRGMNPLPTGAKLLRTHRRALRIILPLALCLAGLFLLRRRSAV